MKNSGNTLRVRVDSPAIKWQKQTPGDILWAAMSYTASVTSPNNISLF